MASLRLAFLAATCALLLAASASPPLPPPPAAQSDSGDEMGWTVVPPAGNGTDGTLTQWAERQRFHVGDVLDFKSWNGTVLLLARRHDYERCATGAAATRFATGSGGGTMFQLERPGTFYFASGVPGRCEAGQRMAVRAVVEAPFFSFAPTSGVNPGDDTTAPPPPPPPTVVFKLTPSAWLWIGTVGVLLVLLVGVSCYCFIEQGRLSKVFLGALGIRLEHLYTELARV
ncbi:unnamed protein product [Urochloa humidicola]